MKAPEKRAKPRTPARSIMVCINGRCQQVYGFARDISSSGIGFRTFTTSQPYPIDVGEKVRLEFRLPESGLDISCEAEVVWNTASGIDTLTMIYQGFRFTAVDPSVQDGLSAWVTRRL